MNTTPISHSYVLPGVGGKRFGNEVKPKNKGVREKWFYISLPNSTIIKWQSMELNFPS